MERTALLDKILAYYTNWYDIERCDGTEEPMVATAAFHEHGTAYMISQKAEMWSTDRHEYAYFFSLPVLDGAAYDACFSKAYALGEALVDPDKGNHMNTNIVVYFLTDHAEEDAILRLRKCRIRKNFQFGLKGWMEVHVACVDTGADTAYANGAGRKEREFLDKMLHPPKDWGAPIRKLLRK